MLQPFASRYLGLVSTLKMMAPAVSTPSQAQQKQNRREVVSRISSVLVDWVIVVKD